MVRRVCLYILTGFSIVSLWGQKPKSVDREVLMSEVVVTGTRNETNPRLLPMSVSVISSRQIESRNELSLLPLLSEEVPGLFITGRGVMGYGVSGGAAGGMRMRGVGGSPTTGMLVLIDGHPQYMGLMGHPIADAYQSMWAERVEVVRGPASVLYGSNAMGGVINILTPQLKDDGWRNNVRMSYGSFNTAVGELSSRFRHKRFTASVVGSYNRSDGHRERMGFEQYGGYAKFGYELSSLWRLFADVNLTHFNASNPGTESRPLFDNDSRVTRGMTSLSLENNYEQTSGAFKLFYNWGHHRINDGYASDEAPKNYLFDSTDRMLGLTWYQSISFFTGNRVTFGLDYQLFGGVARNDFSDGRIVPIVDQTEQEAAAYVDFRQVVGNWMTVDVGLRYDYHTRTQSEWIPQAGVSFYPVANGELKAMVGKGFRNPTIRELYMFGPKNPDLLPERLLNYELSWQQRLSKGLTYGVNLYYINGENLIQTLPVNGRPLNINSGRIENWGVELTAAYPLLPELSVSANYAWLHMVNPVPAAPEHKLFVGLNFSKGAWSVSTGVQYVDGLYTSLEPLGQESFVLWNLRGGYRPCRWAELFVKGDNLLAQRYEINLGYPMPLATVEGGVKVHF